MKKFKYLVTEIEFRRNTFEVIAVDAADVGYVLEHNEKEKMSSFRNEVIDKRIVSIEEVPYDLKSYTGSIEKG